TLFLDTHFSYFKLFPKVTNPHYFSWTDPRRAEIILQAKLCLEQYNFKYKRLIISPYITDIAEKMLNHWRENEWSCTLIAGGKSVGKSTSIRCLINSLLATSKKVVLIDVDPGQAECTPPGCISCSWTFCDETFIDWNRPCEHDFCMIYSEVEIARKNEFNIEPYQRRELLMLSYLSSIVHNKNDSIQCNTELSFNINEVVPYMASFSSLCIIPQRLFGIPASHALNVINGNIVALCGIDLTKESPEKSIDISNFQVLTQRSPLCTCYGFGIIRGIDMERQEVFIITPLPISIMQYVNCLVGCMPVPPTLLKLHQGAPYVGGNATLPTSREPRRGYFRMRYQNKNKSSKSE
ncbi:Polynucleotide 5'-hydroxyl-kinase NOL9, partial [Cyphomyrmex costatus]